MPFNAIDQLKLRARSLHPEYFALVMATGIVSVGLNEHGMTLPAHVLFWLNCAMYAWLLLLSALRLTFYRAEMLANLVRPGHGSAFLTLIAGTCVLATQCLLVDYHPLAARILATWGALCWLLILYGFLFSSIVRRVKGTLSDTIDGGWLVVVVATQSLAIIAALLAKDGTLQPREDWLFTAMCLYLIGCAWYLILIVLITYRLVLLQVPPASFTPPYWINMGALAISTLAGSQIILSAPSLGPLHDLLPFVKGFTLFYWAMATWWIPLLAVLEWWRHGLSHVPPKYEVANWSIVFPLGMYAVSTNAVTHVLGLHYLTLTLIDDAMVYIGALTWIWVAIGLIRRVLGITRAN